MKSSTLGRLGEVVGSGEIWSTGFVIEEVGGAELAFALAGSIGGAELALLPAGTMGGRELTRLPEAQRRTGLVAG